MSCLITHKRTHWANRFACAERFVSHNWWLSSRLRFKARSWFSWFAWIT